MDIDKYLEAEQKLIKIEDVNGALNYYKRVKKDSLQYHEFLNDAVVTDFKNKTIADLEYQKRQLEIEFENL